MSAGEIKITYAELGLGVLVVLLTVLLIFSYISDGECACTDAPENTTGAVVKETAQPEATVPAEEETTEEPEEPPEPTCNDNELNQDETAVDCGGSCAPCADGLACERDDDCESGDCTAGQCQALPELSGEAEFSFTDVETEEAASGAMKVTGVSVSVENGYAENKEFELEIYLKSDNDFYYLNQNEDALEREKYDPYAIVPLTPVPSGETLELDADLGGLYLASSYVYSVEPGVYDNGDDFRVEVRLVDSVTGDVLKQAQRRVRA